MGIEIERKFLVGDESWRAQASRRGATRASVRVRLAGDRAWLNIKSAELGVQRAEYEYPIPVDDARRMLEELCDGVVEKVRHYVEVDGALFEVDEFGGANRGLVVAEIELAAPDAAYPRPSWLGREVSALARYYNVALIEHPYRDWSAAERAAEDAAC